VVAQIEFARLTVGLAVECKGCKMIEIAFEMFGKIVMKEVVEEVKFMAVELKLRLWFFRYLVVLS
jgi:hypothetical protein